MTSNARPDTWLRCLRRLPAILSTVLLALALSACGPGSGGTGTGPIGDIYFGSMVGTSGGVTLPTSVQLQLRDGVVTLDIGCGSSVFTGTWSGPADAAEVTLSGRLDGAPPTGPATLRLQFAGTAETSEAATVTLVDAAGTVLFGPVPLNRAVGPDRSCS